MRARKQGTRVVRRKMLSCPVCCGTAGAGEALPGPPEIRATVTGLEQNLVYTLPRRPRALAKSRLRLGRCLAMSSGKSGGLSHMASVGKRGRKGCASRGGGDAVAARGGPATASRPALRKCYGLFNFSERETAQPTVFGFGDPCEIAEKRVTTRLSRAPEPGCDSW